MVIGPNGICALGIGRLRSRGIPERDDTLDWIDGDNRAAAVPAIEVKLLIKPKTPIVRKGD